MDCPHCGSGHTKRNGGIRGVCHDCRKSFNAPKPSLTQPDNLPDGVKLRGTSTLVDVRTGDTVLQWIKTTADEAARDAALKAALDAIAADLPKVAPRKASGVWNTELLTAYPIGDPHVGMSSWPAETGEDWNLDIAKRMHCEAMDALVASAPPSETALIVNLGDMLHYDSMEPKTPRSGHMLDADGRYAKVIDVAVATIRQCIESALTKHKHVHVVNVRGNHDETGALWLARLLAITYEREPRVSVDTSPSVFNYYRFGKCLIGMHHGHTAKAATLPGVMAADRARDWGECTYRAWWQGHIHHESKKEFPGVTVESFNTLAARDAYATEGGWRSARVMQAIVLHKTHGEVARSRVNAAMFEEAA